MCTCRGCYLLFTAENAELRYRAVPDRHLSFPAFHLEPGQWTTSRSRWGSRSSSSTRYWTAGVCFYPGPAGAAESELPLDAWQRVVDDNPDLAVVAPDVEALMVRIRPDSGECFLIPIDACYELVGRLRQVWRGFDGGQDARREIDAFFGSVATKARPAARSRRL